MNDLEKQARLFDLLGEQATNALNEQDKKELEDLLDTFPEWQNDDSFALTAAAINLSALPADEEMPAHLKSKILADSEKYFTAQAYSNKELQFDRKINEAESEPEVSVRGLGCQQIVDVGEHDAADVKPAGRLRSPRARVTAVPRTRPFIVSRRASMYLAVWSRPHARVEYRRIEARSARAISVRASRFTGWQTGRRFGPRSRTQSAARLRRLRSRGRERP